MSGRTFDVVVIGGGIVGSSAAYRLARRGASVALIDRSEPGYATGAGAGIMSPGTHRSQAEAFYPLSFASMAFYSELLANLAGDGETDTGYATPGQLFVATSEDEAAGLPELLQLASERHAQGVPNIGEARQITGAEARELFPALADVPAALHIPGGARLEARTMRQAMQRAAKRHGLTIINGSAAVLPNGDQVTTVQVNGEALAAGAVLLATGAWSADLAATLGFSLPIEPQRGQIIHLSMPETVTTNWPIVSGFHSHYQLTFPTNRIVVGATREYKSGFDRRLTAAGVHEVLSEALRVSPGLGQATIEEMRIGFRPASPDQIPVLGQAPGYRNLYLATGHGPSGLQLGPFSGAIVADLALGIPSSLDLSPYSADRFQ